MVVVNTFVRAKGKTIDASGGFDLLPELFDFLLFLFEQPSDSVESFGEVFLVFRGFVSLGLALVVGFEFVFKLVIFPHQDRVFILEVGKSLFKVGHALLVAG